MGPYLLAMVIFGGVFAATIVLASKHASKEAQLQNLKAELKKQAEEQRRAQQITERVYALSGDDARKRLHDVANRQR